MVNSVGMFEINSLIERAHVDIIKQLPSNLMYVKVDIFKTNPQ